MTPIRLAPFEKRKGADAGFFLTIRSALSGDGIEFIALDHEDNVVISTVLQQTASALSLCSGVIALIKRCDPTALIITDVELGLS